MLFTHNKSSNLTITIIFHNSYMNNMLKFYYQNIPSATPDAIYITH